MKLLKIRIERFRRFSGTCSLDVDESVIALVGPNEAGKSSILTAIEMLLDGRAPEQRDITRGSAGSASVGGLFYLEEEDRAVIAAIYEGDLVQRVWVTRASGSDSTTWGLEPHPRRDLGPRQRCAALVAELQGDTALDAQYSVNPDLPWDPQLFVNVAEHLTSTEETLAPEVIDALDSLAARLRDLVYPQPEASEDDDEESRQTLAENEHRREARSIAASALEQLGQHERQPRPWRQVVDALQNRLPAVAFFRSEDRELQTTYVLAEIVNDPPHALNNLCTVAGLEIPDLAATWETNKPHVEKLVEDANAILKDRFQMTWNQSTVYPRFGAPNDGILRLFISTEGDVDYSEVQERSDGLRWFLALDAFLAAQGAQLPVLLVDEAETHLHYDAQADLVDALMRQKIAAKIIYTTHSIGCLPPDLGRGIRAVLPERNTERSKIENSYWSIVPEDNDKVGYTPLLFAMGASLLSLTVPRFGLICEGPSDAILLPTLMREVAELSRLTYRVVPGLSEIARSQMAALPQHAGRVACLTDGDGPGNQLLQQIRDAEAVDDACLFSLSSVLDGCTLEDLVDANAFAHAVNIEFETWGITGARLTSADIPDVGRSAAVKAFCEANGGNSSSLNKNRIAQRIVDLRSTGEDGTEPRILVAESVRDPLKSLHDAVTAVLTEKAK